MNHENDIPVGDKEFARVAATAEEWHKAPSLMFEAIDSLFSDICEFTYDEPVGDEADRRIRSYELEAKLYEAAFATYLVNLKAGAVLFPVDLLRELAALPIGYATLEQLKLFNFHLGCLRALAGPSTTGRAGGEWHSDHTRQKTREATAEQVELARQALAETNTNPHAISVEGLKIKMRDSNRKTFSRQVMCRILAALKAESPEP